jgi:DNA-directed RNA polymerase specialized sigma24 family protein
MSNNESVTQWLERLQQNPDDSAAQQQIFRRYFLDLIGYARNQLRTSPKRAADEEDVALEALSALFRGIRDERFEQLDDREDLWQLLRMLAQRRAIDQLRRDHSPKRYALGESVLADVNSSNGDFNPIQQVAGGELPPDVLTQLHEAFCRRLEMLVDPEYVKLDLQRIAMWKLEGLTNGEIAERLNCVTRTVERRLDLIRKVWADHLPGSGLAIP